MTSRGVGLLAAGLAGACALALAVIASTAGSDGPPEEIPRWLVLAALFGTPAAIGAIGAVSGRRVLLLAAGVLCLCLSVLAFSGVTLILLLPALLFLRAGVSDTHPAPPREPARPIRLIVLTILAVPLALLLVTRLGIFGLQPIVALGGLAAGLGRVGTPRPRPQDGVAGLAIVALVLGAAFAVFAQTQTGCWIARSTPEGLVYEQIPVSNELGPIGGDTGIVASGCSSGQLTIDGAAVGGVLLIGAVAISALAASTGRPIP